MKKSNIKKIGFTIGDLNGIGPQIILSAFSNNDLFNQCTPYVFGNKKALTFYKDFLKLGNSINIIGVSSTQEFHKKHIHVIDCFDIINPPSPGERNEENGTYARNSIDLAVEAIKKCEIDAIVTCPIDKELTFKNASYGGHTEYLQHLSDQASSIMLMVSDTLRIGLATNHIAIKDIASTLDKSLILNKLKQLKESLIHDFGISSPKIGVLGLNPHSGDNGKIGTEESMIIEAINHAKSIDILAFGPYPADGFFGCGDYTKFDGILAMYHDQGLIPFKTLSFGSGVNYTAGLPFIRTSPDHGTAFDIAKEKNARPDSLRNAIYLALDIIKIKSQS